MQARGFSVVLVLVSSSGPGSKPFTTEPTEKPHGPFSVISVTSVVNNAFKGFGYRFS